jgi:malonyl-CoA/methylmalonyl-CoA synthetase
MISTGPGTVDLTPIPDRWASAWSGDAGEVLRCEDSSGWRSATEVAERTEAMAGALQARGAGTGTRVLWQAGPELETVLAGLAVLRSGATLVPVNAAQSALERAVVAEDTEPVLVIAPRHRHEETTAASVTPEDLGVGAYHAPRLTTDDLALIVYTSGTTGNPKGAMLTHGNLAAGLSALEQAWGLSAQDRLASALPLFHVHGLVAGLFGILAAGGSLDLQARFEASSFLETAATATMAYCVPTMLHRMASASNLSDLRGLRLLVSGSAPLSVELFEAIASGGGQRILERYGMTETLLTLSNPLAGERRPGTVGRPLPGISAMVPEPGEGEAELKIAGPSVFAGYWRRPEATAEVLTEGWMSTGDLVRVGDGGYVTICGRSKELIISGGYNVYPSEVEDVLVAQPGVAEAAVVGRASPEWGEEVTAFVVLEDATIDVEQLRGRLQGLMSPYKVPRSIHVVNELPRNAMGKLQRHLL